MLCEKCGNQMPDNVDFCTNCGNKISEDTNQNVHVINSDINVKRVFFGVLLGICLIIFIALAIQPDPEKVYEVKDVKKISEYLQNKYSEEFSDIELLSVMQNENDIRCDGSSLWKEKIKDDYTHYYKAYSNKNDIEFYAYIHKSKKDNIYSESISDNYSEILAVKNSANEILEEVEKIFNNLVEYSYITKGDNYDVEEGNTKSIDIKEEFRKLQPGIGKTNLGYFHDNRLPIGMYFKVNLSFKKLSNDRFPDLMKLTKFFASLPNKTEEEMRSYNKTKEELDIYIKTSDGYTFTIDKCASSARDTLGNLVAQYWGIEYYDPQGEYHYWREEELCSQR